jgi:hypothetical protein
MDKHVNSIASSRSDMDHTIHTWLFLNIHSISSFHPEQMPSSENRPEGKQTENRVEKTKGQAMNQLKPPDLFPVYF